MKIRNGFVSNSSSSSFILALPKSNFPLSYIKLMDVFTMKKDDENLSVEIYDNNTNSYDTMRFHPKFINQEIAKLLHSEDSRDEKRILDDLKSGYLCGYSDMPDPRKDWEAFKSFAYNDYLTDEEYCQINGDDYDKFDVFNEEKYDELLLVAKERAIKYLEDNKHLLQPNYNDYFRYDNNCEPTLSKSEEYKQDMKDWSERVLKDFKEKNTDKDIYVISVGDDSILTNYFQYQFNWEKWVPILRVSHH